MNATGAKIENKLKQKLHKREINSIMNIEWEMILCGVVERGIERPVGWRGTRVHTLRVKHVEELVAEWSRVC